MARDEAPAPAARALARRLGRQAVLETRNGAVRALARLDGFVTGPSGEDAAAVALGYVRAHRDVFGELGGLRLVRRYTSRDGVTHLQWVQTVRGVPVLGAELRANVTRDGRLVNILGGPRADLRAGTVTPRLDAAAALAAARGAVGGSRALIPRGATRPGPERATRFAGGEDARLVLFALPDRVTVAWQLTVRGEELYDGAEAVRFVRVTLEAGCGLAELQVYATKNLRPSAAFDWSPEDPVTDEPVTFTAAASQDFDGKIVRYEWDLDGNGSFETDTGAVPTVSHVYGAPGTVKVNLRVTDDKRDTDDTGWQSVDVQGGAEIVDLGDLPGRPFVHPGDVNRLREVVGDAETAPGGNVVSPRAFRFAGEAPAELPGPGGKSVAFSLNTAGQAVGWWDPPDPDLDYRAVLWSGGSAIELGTLGGDNSIARGINAAGQIVGQAEVKAGVWHAFSRVAGVMGDLGTLDPSDNKADSVAYDVNAAGQVVGWSDVPGDGWHAFLKPGPLVDLGTMGGENSEAWAINQGGQVVGWSDTGFGWAEPFLYTDGEMRSLGGLGGGDGAARDIDTAGRVVGYSRDKSGVYHAFLYRDGRMIALERLLPKDSGWTALTAANGINDAGQIVGYGIDAEGQERGFLLDLEGCEICVDKLAIEQRDVKSGAWKKLTRADIVVDGNRLRITATIANHGTESQAMNVRFTDVETGQELPGSRQGEALNPGQSKDVVYEWDTDGAAWHAGRPVTVRPVRVRLDVGRTVFDARTRVVQVQPRPVVAVHGLNATADTWSRYRDILRAAHRNWLFLAVGDGIATSEAMDTGSLSAPFAVPNTIQENAEIVGRYVQAVREIYNAPQVDLLGHSMGGLIARQYVDSIVSSPASVHSLVMLGTPNEGSSCADLFPLPETYELRRDSVALFNGRVTNRHGVPMSVVAGDPLDYTCAEPAQGDGVVSVASARHDFADFGTLPILHTEMTGSQQLFDYWVKPHLVPGLTAPGPAPRRAAAAAAAAGRELLKTDVVTVGARATVDVSVAVPAASRVGVVHMAAPEVASELLDPDGRRAGAAIAAGSPEAAQPYRTLAAAGPAAGTWRLRLTNTGSEPVSVPVTAWVEGNPIGLDVAVTGAGDALAIVATPHDGVVPLSGATVTATLRGLSGATKTGTLLAAGDGTYRWTTPGLRSGRRLVAVTAEGTHAGAPYSRVAIASGSVSFVARGANGAIVSQRSDGLYVVRPDGSDETKLPFDGEQPQFSPDGRRVVYTQDGDLWIAPVDGSGPPARVTSGPALDRDAAWSPGGSFLVFTRVVGDGPPWKDGIAQGIWIRDLRNGGERRLTSMRGCGRECQSPTGPAVIDYQPTWSPEGDEIAFVRYLWTGGSAIYVVEQADDEAVPRELGTSYFLRDVSSPDWSPDGSRIAFMRETRGTSGRRRAIGSIRPDGTGLRMLAVPERCHPIVDGRRCEVDYGDPDWSPDGALFVVTSNRDAIGAEADNDALYVLSAGAGVGTARLTGHAFAQSVPDWGTLTTDSLERLPVCLDSAADVPGDRSTALALLCSDANGDPLQRAIVAGPAHGTLAAIDQAAGTVLYTPAPGFRGRDQLTFRASEGTGSSNVARVTITVVEPPPPPPPPESPGPAGGGSSTSSGGGGSSAGGGGSRGGGHPLNGTCSGPWCTVVVGNCPPACDGDASNGSPGPRAAALASRFRPLFRRARFSVRPGQRAIVRLRLTALGRKQLRRRGKLRTGFVVRYRMGRGPYTRQTGTLTLRMRGGRR